VASPPAATSIFLSHIWLKFIRKLQFSSLRLTGWCFICTFFM